MYTNTRILAAVGCLLISFAPCTSVMGQVPDEEDTERCVDLRAIDRTDVVDDYNILFYMRSGDIYVNHLPRRCPGLRRERTFSYRTTMSRLCNVDLITVLDNMGSGFQPSVSCGLGLFYPITSEEAKALKEAPPKEVQPEDVPPAEPEEVGGER
jgi:hypothetical protein